MNADRSQNNKAPEWLDIYQVRDYEGASFEDVIGLERAKTELKTVLARIQYPADIEAAGGRVLPSGLLLHGPVGVGKTMLVAALVSELARTDAEVLFYTLPAGDLTGPKVAEIGHWLAGDRSERVIIFIDEIDAFARVGPQRSATLLELLTVMDGLDSRTGRGVVWVGATSLSPYLIDLALTRPGRLGFHVAVDLPNLATRQEMFRRFLAPVRLAEPIDTLRAARMVGMTSGAAIRQMVDDAVAIAIAENPKNSVRWEHVLAAIGRDGRIEEDSEFGDLHRIAIHEASHVAVAESLNISIESARVGPSRGHVQLSPAVMTVDLMRRKLCALLAGDEGEAILLGTRGPASSDLLNASNCAFEIVLAGGTPLEPVDQRVWHHSRLAANEHYKAVRALMADARAQARSIIERRQAEITALADRLALSGNLVSEDLPAPQRRAGL